MDVFPVDIRSGGTLHNHLHLLCPPRSSPVHTARQAGRQRAVAKALPPDYAHRRCHRCYLSHLLRAVPRCTCHGTAQYAHGARARTRLPACRERVQDVRVPELHRPGAHLRGQLLQPHHLRAAQRHLP